MSYAAPQAAVKANKPAFLNTQEDMHREKDAASGSAGIGWARSPAPSAAPSAAAAPGLTPDTAQSQPSKTISAASRAAWGEWEKANSELTRITNTYSRLRQVYNLPPFKGQSLFAGILDAGRAGQISSRLSDAAKAKYKMQAILDGNEQIINEVRKESGETRAFFVPQADGAATRTSAPQAAAPETAAPEAAAPKQETPKQGTPKAKGLETDTPALEGVAQEGAAQEPTVVEDAPELIDYLRRRYFWPVSNDIYNTARDLYVRRDIRVDSTLAFRSNFEADEDEGFFASVAKYASTFRTRKEALKHIDRIQGYFFPKVPPHETGLANRDTLIPFAIRNLDALDRSHLPELQESYFTVSNDKDSALDTAIFLKDALEVTKAASEMVISTGTTILTGGNPVAEGLVSGLYSGALSLAEQASNSSVAEGEFKKAKRALDASGLDPGSPEYKQALEALENKRKESEVSWKKVGIDAGVSLAFSAAPGLGKWAKGSKFAKGITNKVGKFGDWAKGTGLGKGLSSLKNKVTGSKAWEKLGLLKQKAINLRDTIKRPINSLKDGASRYFNKAKTAVGDFFGSGWRKLTQSTFGQGVRNTFSKIHGALPGFLTHKIFLRNTGLGKKFVSGYHKLFDRFSYKNLAQRDLDNARHGLLPGFEKGAVTSSEAEELLKQGAQKTAANQAGKQSAEEVAEQAMKEREAARLTELAQKDVFEKDLTESLSTELKRARANLARVSIETQGWTDELRKPLMEKATREWAELEAKAAKAGVGQSLSEGAEAGIKDEVQEDLARAFMHQGSHTSAITDEQAFANSFVLNQASRTNRQVGEYMTANREFQEISDQALEYAQKSSAKAGLVDYGADLLTPLGDKAKDQIQDYMKQKVEETTGIPLGTVTEYLEMADSFTEDPLKAGKDTLEKKFLDKDELQEKSKDFLMHLGEEKEGKEEEGSNDDE